MLINYEEQSELDDGQPLESRSAPAYIQVTGGDQHCDFARGQLKCEKSCDVG